MPAPLLGSTTVVTLVSAALLCPFPSRPGVALALGLGALWLEKGGLDLDQARSQRFSPAVPLYLTMASLPGVGSGLAGLFLLVDAVFRMDRGLVANLAQRVPLALALLAVAAVEKLLPDSTLLVHLTGPLAYLLATWAYRGQALRALGEIDRRTQSQLQLRIGPLEVGLAALAPVLTLAVQSHPAYILGALPVLACAHLAAENAMLTAHDETVAEVLEQLREAQSQARTATRQRDKAVQEKKLLEGFTRHLSGQPDLSSIATELVATVRGLMPVDNVVLFLGAPPEPYYYHVRKQRQAALQGASLTALREPLVDRAFQQKKPVLQKRPPEVDERLLPEDQVAAALPLGGAGVLYAGRETSQPFAPAELEQLKWLSSKAVLVLEAAFAGHEESRRQRLQEQTVHRLEKQVAWLSQLIAGAEAMASSLQREVLVKRFTTALTQTIPHLGGQLQLAGQPRVDWGEALEFHPELLETAHGMGRPLVIEDTASSRFGAPSPRSKSLVISPLLAGQESLGLLLLSSDRRGGFSSEQVDLMFLLSSQAAMALSHAGLYTEVVEARKQLEISQASLVQSSKLTAIGQLAAGVAHELNSPLGAISLSVGEALNQFEDRPELSRKMLGRARDAVLKAKEIVDRLMAYSRKTDHKPRKLALEVLVGETVEFLAFQLKNAGVTVNLKAETNCWVEGEEQPLQQVVTNLILNAAQAMEDKKSSGTRLLELDLMTSKDSVTLRISDQGCGISPENLARIFDPFFTTKPVGRGTGLGLWACQQIVTQHQGTVEVESVPDQGSTFVVSLPRATGRP